MIRVSKLADYGILLMTWLAFRHARPGHTHPGHTHPGHTRPRRDVARRSAAELAKETGLPAPTVSKLLGLLSRAGLLDAQRGAHGGYALARTPAEMSVAEVIAAIEGPIALISCLDDSTPECEVESFCPTRTNWDRINQAILGALDSISLDEMATPQRGWRERMSQSLQTMAPADSMGDAR